jgi:hypothetical protein
MLGPIGTIEGRIVGLNPFLKVTGDTASVVVAHHMIKRQAAKDHNDRPTSRIVGTQGGTPVTEKPEYKERP